MYKVVERVDGTWEATREGMSGVGTGSTQEEAISDLIDTHEQPLININKNGQDSTETKGS